MSRRTYTWNAYESQLAGPLLSGSTSVAVDSAIGLDAPCYLVIDPDIPLKREWIRVNTINANNLENMIRDQQGSVGNIDHESGAKVRAIFTKQVQDDFFDDIEDAELWITGHVNVIQQPHPHTQYLREGDADGLYVQLTGAIPMTGPLTLWGDPTQVLHAATMQYVDGSQTFLHDDLTDVVSDQHHTRYADSEAVAAVGTPWVGQYLPLVGGVLTGILDIGGSAAGIRYTGAGGANTVALKWGSGHITARIDGSVDVQLANVSDLGGFYTKAEVDSLIAGLQSQINGKAPTTHNHTAAQTTSGVFNIARIPSIPASKVTGGSFPSGQSYTFLSDVGIAGTFQVNGAVTFLGLSAGAGTAGVRINAGTGLLSYQ